MLIEGKDNVTRRENLKEWKKTLRYAVLPRDNAKINGLLRPKRDVQRSLHAPNIGCSKKPAM